MIPVAGGGGRHTDRTLSWGWSVSPLAARPWWAAPALGLLVSQALLGGWPSLGPAQPQKPGEGARQAPGPLSPPAHPWEAHPTPAATSTSPGVTQLSCTQPLGLLVTTAFSFSSLKCSIDTVLRQGEHLCPGVPMMVALAPGSHGGPMTSQALSSGSAPGQTLSLQGGHSP